MTRKLLASLKYLGGAVILGFLLYMVDLRLLVDVLKQISIIDLITLAFISFLLIAVSVVKWRMFLNRLGVDASFWRLFGLYLVGYFVNLIMPSYIGGDLVRSLYVGGGVEGKSGGVSATVLERFTGLVAMVLIALVCVWWVPGVTWQMNLFTCVLALGLCVGSYLLFSGWIIWGLRKFSLLGRWVGAAEKLQQALVFGIQDRRLLRNAFLLSFIFHFLTIVNTAAVGHAVGWSNIPIGGLCVAVPLILVVGAIPIAPQGLGIQEGAFLYFLHSLGATPAQALAVGLVLRAKSYVLALLGGMVWGSGVGAKRKG